MSENDRLHLVASTKKTDARVRRTRDALGDAMVALMLEKPFDSITVQDVLDRANVGRSTFYTHYSDKDDLLMSDAEEFFEAVAMSLSARGDKSDRVFPVREFFGHITEAKQFVDALMSAGKFNDSMELARGHVCARHRKATGGVAARPGDSGERTAGDCVCARRRFAGVVDVVDRSWHEADAGGDGSVIPSVGLAGRIT